MKKQIVFFLIASLLLALILCVRFCVAEPNSWFSNWGTYFFIVPMLLFFSAALLSKTYNSKYLAAYTLGVIISVILIRGNWADNYVLQKLIATISGAIISYIIYVCFLATSKKEG